MTREDELMSTDMLTWLRATIQGDKAAAEVASEVVDDGGWSPYRDWSDFNGTWVTNEDIDHIQRQDPPNTIARCEADLMLLDLHKAKPGARYISRNEEVPGEVCEVCCHDSDWGIAYGHYPCPTLQILAYCHRRRPGWLEGWAPARAS